ncbi:hypothetical protein YC2023_078440 [Brassica napus]|uniref:(rape) hypothetical protein n=1 Tax=Brassica napus TaxID=3708 RepID=A0A816QJA8_BRANA|nr:unnamed protein product [Brassica napus]
MPLLQLHPDVPEEDIEFSDYDLKFVEENTDYAPIRHSQCVGEQTTVEDRYEEEKGSSNEIQVDPVDSFYVTVTKTSKLAKGDTDEAEEDAELNGELSAEETFENKKNKLEELGMQLLSDPEANIRTIKEFEMLDISKDGNRKIVKLGLLSVLAVFKDIIPGLPTEKELEMKVSKAVKKTRFYESTLLKAYKVCMSSILDS